MEMEDVEKKNCTTNTSASSLRTEVQINTGLNQYTTYIFHPFSEQLLSNPQPNSIIPFSGADLGLAGKRLFAELAETVVQ
jgi:hypothetical protein